MEEEDIRQLVHQKTQLDLLEKCETELFSLREYIEKNYELIKSDVKPFEFMKKCITKLGKLLEIADKCKRSYHFGCEIFLYYVGIIMENDVKIIKAESNNYENSLSGIMMHKLFNNLYNNLELIPFTGYVFKNAPQSLKNSLMEEDYKKVIECVKNYLEIGYALKDDAIIARIKSELPKLRGSTLAYYAAIIGPSFMGKTQTAFTLSHCMTVLYINLLIGSKSDADLSINQDIYKAFFSFSRILNSVIYDDLHEVEMIGGDIDASDLNSEKQQEISYKILGLILVLIKMKMMRTDITMFEWYKCIIDIEKVLIPTMTITEFMNATTIDSGINLNEVTVFIDELSRDPDNVKRTKFIRNICRATRLPVILSGTNSRVNNLIGKDFYFTSGLSQMFRLWVKILTELPKSTLKSLGCSVKFIGIDKIEHRLGEFVESGASSINYNRLFSVLLPSERRTPEIIADLRGFLEMLFKQSKTNLPGVAYLSISQAFNQVSETAGLIDVKDLWKEVVVFVSKALARRKFSLMQEFGLIASIHALTFPTLDLKEIHESGQNSANKVDYHYFYYGQKVGDKIFDLSVCNVSIPNNETNENIQLFKSNGQIFVDSCYFPELKDDVLLNIGSWQVWWNLINENTRNFTIGYLFQKYLQSAGKFFINSAANVPDSFSLELFAHWSICYASHQNLNGAASAIDVMKEFIINVQSRFYCRPPPSEPVISRITQLVFDFEMIPASLSTFLANFSVPYLVQSDYYTNILASFVKLGRSDRLHNDEGWDVKFDLFFGNEIFPSKGYIECKLMSSAVGLPLLLPYYKKAGLNGHKVSFLLAKNIQVSMQTQGAAKKFTSKPKKRKLDTDYNESFEELWEDPRYKINLYSVVLDENDNIFKFGTLKEFADPAGVFTLVQTNFSPPHRSSIP